MRTLTKITIVAVAALLVAAVAQPVQASCATPSLIGTNAGPAGVSFVWTSGVFNPSYYAGYPPLMYSADASPPVTGNFSGVYWRQATGDPAPGLGDDSGTYAWTEQGGFYYAASPAYGGYYGYYSGGTIFSSWFPPGVDGCVGGNACMCVLMTDSDGMTGYFALTGAMSAATTDTFLNQGGSDAAGNNTPIILVPIPSPRITGSERVPDGVGGFDVNLSVTVDPLGGSGVYVKDGCNCGPTGFRVKHQVLARNAMPPADRSAGWVEAALSDGNPQPVGGTPVGGAVTVRATCGGSDSDTYLGTELLFDSGFGTGIVSANSTRVECGPNLADPDDRPTNRPRVKPDRPKPRRR